MIPKKNKKSTEVRVSVDVNAPYSQGFLMDGMYLRHPFDPQVYDLLANYSIIFSDFAQAVANMQFTPKAHPRVDIVFSDSVVSSKQKEKISIQIADAVNAFWERVYPSGVSGFVVDTVGQACRDGAVSIEWILDTQKPQVARVVHVPVKTIRFKPAINGAPLPVQVGTNNGIQNPQKLGQLITEIDLNVPTYVYAPVETLNGLPYGIPPYLSVLQKLNIQDGIIVNIEAIVNKLGLLGFVSLLMERPEQNPGESTEAYTARLKGYVEGWATQLDKNFNRGLVVGYKDMMDMEYHAIAGDARGVTQVTQVLEEQIISGFKSDPAMFGRTYSTTETYAGVVYDKFINMLDHFLEITAAAAKKGLMFQLQFEGIRVKSINVIFDKPKSLTAKTDAEADVAKTNNVIVKRNAGFIDQNQAARELGYDRPFAPGDIITPAQQMANDLENARIKSSESKPAVERPTSTKKTKNGVSLMYDLASHRYVVA